MLEDPFSSAVKRANLAGRILADFLQEHVRRPVTLIATSMSCLLVLSTLDRLKDDYPFIQNVVLMGAPVRVTDVKRWARYRRLVHDRLVVAHSQEDWLVGFLSRGVRGTLLGQSNLPGIDVVNVTSEIGGHIGYADPERVLSALSLCMRE
jgi:hypothetical protein